MDDTRRRRKNGACFRVTLTGHRISPLLYITGHPYYVPDREVGILVAGLDEEEARERASVLAPGLLPDFDVVTIGSITLRCRPGTHLDESTYS